MNPTPPNQKHISEIWNRDPDIVVPLAQSSCSGFEVRRLLHLFDMRMPDTPKTNQQTSSTSTKCHHVGAPVTHKAIIAYPLSTWEDLAVRVEDLAVKMLKMLPEKIGATVMVPQF